VTVLFVRSLTPAENCTVLPATTEGALGEMVTVAARSELAVVSRMANRIIPEVLNLRIIKKAPYTDVCPDGVPKLSRG